MLMRSGRRFFSSAVRYDYGCELAASNIRYGKGVTKEIGQDLTELNCRHVALFTDNNIKELPAMQTVLNSLNNANMTVHTFTDVRVEPTDQSFRKAIAFLTEKNSQLNGSGHGKIDAVVALGGGSVLDTAKAANLYTCYPTEDFYDYVNPIVGKGKPVPGPVLPLFAIPTTAGTGSETTGVAIFDDTNTGSKTGIASRRLKPYLGIVDPDNTITLPAEVAKYSGFDVLAHAMESYTALPFNQRPYSEIRPAYQGSNPISDIWSLHALKMTKKYLKRVVLDNMNDAEAREQMLLASATAGVGFGNAGVHLCHGMSYPIASQVTTYQPPSGYEKNKVMIPHGHSVIVNAPAVFRFTASASPDRHLNCLKILNQKYEHHQINSKDVGNYLYEELVLLMQDLNVPLGLKPLGYNEGNIELLVKGTLPQHRVTKLSPKPVAEKELTQLFLDAMEYK